MGNLGAFCGAVSRRRYVTKAIRMHYVQSCQMWPAMGNSNLSLVYTTGWIEIHFFGQWTKGKYGISHHPGSVLTYIGYISQ